MNTKRRMNRTIALLLALAMVLTCTGVTTAFAGQREKHPLMEERENAKIDAPTSLENIYASDTVSKQSRTVAATDSYYKSPDVTSVKNQGYGDCWAFATVGTIESAAIKAGLAKNSVDLSEGHLVHFFYNRVNDTLGNTERDKNINLSGESDKNVGGDINYTYSALVGWTGAALESTVPYDMQDIPAALAYENEFVVTNVYRLPDMRDEVDLATVKKNVKAQLVESGGLVVAFNADDEYINDNTGACYCPDEGVDPNHEVELVGWDDNYSRNRFKGISKPASDGAWIVKNSWGTASGDNGYYYISYEDKTVCDFVGFEVAKASDYEYNYQYDGAASNAYEVANTGDKIANIYKVKSGSARTATYQVLSEVGFTAISAQMNYKAQVYVKDSAMKSPTDGTLMASASGSTYYPGYYTAKLNNHVHLSSGQYYSIVITPSNADGGNAEMWYGIEESYTVSGDYVKFVADVTAGQSMLYDRSDGKWYDLASEVYLGKYDRNHKSTGYCARIKGYIESREEGPTIAKGEIKKIKRTSKTRLKVYAKKQSIATGYRYAYSLKKASGYKYKTTKSATTTLKGLKKNKRYYVKVQAIVNVNGDKYYGKWSAVKRSK